jgi:toxin-antitoxin system PIN domain toxin
MVVIDTNLLVYAHRAGTPEHRAARSALQTATRQPGGWGIATTSVLEYWSVVTHPEASGRPSMAAEARAFIDALVDVGARLLAPGPAVAQRILEVADRLGVTGARIFDLHIAVTALDHGATELWSHDGAFVTLPGLRLVDPLTRS